MITDLGFKKSPNVIAGRSGWDKKADVIVHHVTEGAFTGAVSWLTNIDSKVSSHFVTANDGRFIQLVQLQDMAWANGNGPSTINEAISETIKSRPNSNANLYSFSIENEGFSYKNNFGVPTPAQREAIKEIHKKIVDHILTYNPDWYATRDNVIGHCHIRSGSKPSCPSPNFGEKFPFNELIDEINEYINSKRNDLLGTVISLNQNKNTSKKKQPAIDPELYPNWPGRYEYTSYDYEVPFILQIAPAIQATMHEGVLNSVRIAQAIIESTYGRSLLAREANNLFGIKAHNKWTGAIYNVNSSEWYPEIGNIVEPSEFRAYADWTESVFDHINFLKVNPRYSGLFNDRDYVSVCNKLQSAGYATNPRYATHLITMIESKNLLWFDTLKPISIDVTQCEESIPTDTVSAAGIQVGTIVKIKPGSTSYSGISLSSFVFNREYEVSYFSSDRVVLDKNGINTPVNVNNLIVVRNGIKRTDELKVGSFVKIKPGAMWATTPETKVPNWVMASTHRIDKLRSDGRAVLNEDGINSPINIKFLEVV